MTINYKANDILLVNSTFVQTTLSSATFSGIKQTLISLGYLGAGTATVLGVGNLGNKSFIRLLPASAASTLHNAGTGSVLYFGTDDQLNNSFTLSGSLPISSSTASAKVINGAVIVTPAVVGGSQVPASPVIFDMGGAELRDLIFDSVGAFRMDFWRSINSDDPANQVALDNGTATIPDYSNIQWSFVKDTNYSEPGIHIVDKGTVDALNACRYAKLDKTHGATISKIHAYGV